MKPRIAELAERIEGVLDLRVMVAGARVGRAIASVVDERVRDGERSGRIELGALGWVVWALTDRHEIALTHTDVAIEATALDVAPGSDSASERPDPERRLDS